MAVVKELIRTEENGAISFGDYELAQKSKLSDYQHQGDMYKVKTFKEITKLERNGMFVYESVPGTAVFNLTQSEAQMDFHVEGPDCLLYTSDAADEEDSVDIGGRRIIKKKKIKKQDAIE